MNGTPGTVNPQNAMTPVMVYDEVFVNIVMLIFYAVFLVYFLTTTFKISKSRHSIRLPVNLAFIMLSIFSWFVVMLLRFAVRSEGLVYILYFLPSVISTATMISILIFTLNFYNRRVFTGKSTVAAAFVIPVTTLFLIFFGYTGLFFGNGFNLIRLNPVVSTAPLNAVFGAVSSWFVLDFSYTALLSVLAVVVVLSHHYSLPRIYREPSKIMIYAVFFALTGVAAELANILTGEHFPIDMTLLGVTLSLQFFFRATLGNQGLVFLSQARNDIINHIENCILILDDYKHITYANNKAQEWLRSMDVYDSSYHTLIERLTESATQCERHKDEESGSDFYFDNGGNTYTYNLREKPIYNNRKEQIGTFVIYSDVTENRALIQRLEVGAGRDALTGLHNRGMMEYLKTELDKPESLPFSVIVCDLNDLKKTNDTYGHQAGDVMLRAAGEVLSTRCPPVAQAGRIGGDEFLILLPQTTKKEADELIALINSHLRMIDDYPYKITLAMGSGTKTSADQTINDAILAADEAMYANKKAIKGSSRDKVGAAAAIA